MPKPMHPRRRACFLQALSETANIALAAERARVSQSWVRHRRSKESEFDRACEEALEAGRTRLGELGPSQFSADQRYFAGQELVVRGRCGRRAQVARARPCEWTPRSEKRFFEALAATCNVKASAHEAGHGLSSAYCYRKRSNAFAERWDEALTIGYHRLEFALLERLGSTEYWPQIDGDAPIPPMRADEAIHLLWMHKKRVYEVGNLPGRKPRLPKLDDVRASILRKIEIIERQEALEKEKANARKAKRGAAAKAAPKNPAPKREAALPHPEPGSNARQRTPWPGLREC